MINKLRSFLFFLFITLWTIFIGIVGLPVILLKRTRIICGIGYIWACVIISFLRLLGISEQIYGQENLPKVPFIIACKHQSAWDTIFFLKYFYNPAYILKKELLQVPFYGWYPKNMGMIAIDRKGGSKMIKEITNGVANILQDKRIAIIFPEGTRVSPKVRSVRYQSGIAALYSEFPDVPIVPVAVNSGLFWSKRGLVRSGAIKLSFLKPIASGLDKEGFMKALLEAIEDETERLTAVDLS